MLGCRYRKLRMRGKLLVIEQCFVILVFFSQLANHRIRANMVQSQIMNRDAAAKNEYPFFP